MFGRHRPRLQVTGRWPRAYLSSEPMPDAGVVAIERAEPTAGDDQSAPERARPNHERALPPIAGSRLVPGPS